MNTSLPEYLPEANVLHSRVEGPNDVLTESEVLAIEQHLGALVLSDDSVLNPHQREAFDDIARFFERGGRECYVKLPTSTGKTVLFVELIRNLMEKAEEKGEHLTSIVLEPTIDLVMQTVGSVDDKTGKRKGFKGFAPEIDARPIHGDVKVKEREANLSEGQALVTTYNTFRNLVSTFGKVESKTKEELELQKAEALSAIEELEDQLVNARKELVFARAEGFIKQEIKAAGLCAFLELKVHERGEGYTGWQAEVMRSIIAITQDGELSNKLKLRRIKAIMRGSVSDEAAEFITALKKAAQERAKVTTGKTSVRRRQLNEDEAMEVNTGKGLSDFDRFQAFFVYRHSSDTMPPNYNFKDADARKNIRNSIEQVEKIRGTIEYKKGVAKSADYYMSVKESFSRFRLMICDEAHRVMGSQTWEAIREYARLQGIAIIAVTATDEYSDRHLKDYLEKVHELTKEEAIRREITNPVALFVHETGLTFNNIGLDASGEYDYATTTTMRLSSERNQIGADYAKALVEAGYRGIIPCIAGGEGAHAYAMAELVNGMDILDPQTGEIRKMRARVVLGGTDIDERKKYYEQLENGEIDWITFVDVIREGWDSDTAKAIISMRPTRSLLLATQRLGRIGRTWPGAPVSIAIDLYDGISGIDEYHRIPPVLGVDVFEAGDVGQGHIIGNIDETESPIVDKLRQLMPSQDINSYYTNYQKMLSKIMVIDARGVGSSRELSGNTDGVWLTYEKIRGLFRGFIPKELLIEATEGEMPAVRVQPGRINQRIIPLFNASDVRKLHIDKPVVDPWRLYIDSENRQWITPEGCTKFLSKRLPRITAYEIDDAVRSIEVETDEEFVKSVGRIRFDHKGSNSLLGLTHMYLFDEIQRRLVPKLLQAKR